MISEADRYASRGSAITGCKYSSGASDVHDVTTDMPSSVVMVVVLDVTVGASCRWTRMPVLLGLDWFRHGNHQATEREGCGSGHSGYRESLFHELIGSMHLL